MILTCPACSTRYLVPDTAIGATGRQVRCASCRHSWFQEPDETTAPPPGAPASAIAAEPAEPIRVFGEEDLSRQSGIDPFEHAPPFRPRRNPARTWTIAAIAVAVLLLAALGGLLAFAPTTMSDKLGIAADPAIRLNILVTRSDRRTMASGNELLELTGRVVNPTDTVQKVPDIRAELRDKSGRVVYSWTIARPAASVPAHGAAEFDSAAVDVPKGAASLKLSFADALGG